MVQLWKCSYDLCRSRRNGYLWHRLLLYKHQPHLLMLWVCGHYAIYVLRSSGITGSVRSREHWLWWDTARKRNALLYCLLLFWESFNCYNFGKNGPIQAGFAAKCSSPNEDFNQVENWKCYMFDFRLIPLDHITYISPFSLITVVEAHCSWPTVKI